MTGAVVLSVASSDYAARWWFCLASQRAYAERHAYAYRLETKDRPPLNHQWSKLAYALDLLRSGCDVFLIDADAELTPDTPRFDTVLDERPDADILFVRGISGRPNSGVMLLRGGDSRAALLMERCLASRETPVPRQDFVTAAGENGHLIHFLRDPFFAERSAELDGRWNCTLPDGFDAAYVRHYTNRLRKSLEDGELDARLSAPLSVRSETDAERRALWLAHHLRRSELVRDLAASPPRLDRFRALVSELGRMRRITFPRLLVDDAEAWMWRYEFATGLLETPTMAIAARLVGPGARILDGGAHVGYFARSLALALDGDCEVLAVEAHPANIAALSANAGDGVRIAHAALGDSAGEAVLHDGSGHSNSTLLAGRHKAARTITVPSTTIDAISAECGVAALDLIKLDVEGFELKALRGAEKILAASPDLVILAEINPKLLALADVGPERLVEHAFERGFVARRINDDFSLGPAGLVDRRHTRNYLLARPERWQAIEPLLFGHDAARPDQYVPAAWTLAEPVAAGPVGARATTWRRQIGKKLPMLRRAYRVMRASRATAR